MCLRSELLFFRNFTCLRGSKTSSGKRSMALGLEMMSFITSLVLSSSHSIAPNQRCIRSTCKARKPRLPSLLRRLVHIAFPIGPGLCHRFRQLRTVRGEVMFLVKVLRQIEKFGPVLCDAEFPRTAANGPLPARSPEKCPPRELLAFEQHRRQIDAVQSKVFRFGVGQSCKCGKQID